MQHYWLHPGFAAERHQVPVIFTFYDGAKVGWVALARPDVLRHCTVRVVNQQPRLLCAEELRQSRHQ